MTHEILYYAKPACAHITGEDLPATNDLAIGCIARCACGQLFELRRPGTIGLWWCLMSRGQIRRAAKAGKIAGRE